MTPRILLATTNPGKIREIRELLADLPIAIVGLEAFPGLAPPVETGATFAENAREKALYYAASTGLTSVAEDSGLEIDGLGGAPGVESARYGGADTPYPEKFRLIYEALRRAGRETSPARFVCALALAEAGRVVFEAHGVVEGTIAPEPAGSEGFGYDPIFFYPPFGCTLAQVPRDRKGEVSHRGAAFRQLRAFLAHRIAPDAPHTPDPPDAPQRKLVMKAGRGRKPLGVTAREDLEGLVAGRQLAQRRDESQLAGRFPYSVDAASGRVARKSTVARPLQELRVYQCAKQGLAHLRFETPQALCLSRRQPQTGHFQVLTLHPGQGIIYRDLPAAERHRRIPLDGETDQRRTGQQPPCPSRPPVGSAQQPTECTKVTDPRPARGAQTVIRQSFDRCLRCIRGV